MYADVSVIAYSGSGNRHFTYKYSSDISIKPGSIVKVKFGKKPSLGVVRSVKVHKPPAKIKVNTIQAVLPLNPLPEHLMLLADWIIEYYLAPSSSVWQLLLPKNPTTTPRKSFNSDKIKTQSLVKLSPQQISALRSINESTKPVLLEGVMGSGKTEVYFHLIQDQLNNGNSAILLMPEIFLTNQMIERAKKHFGSKLLVTHSGLTPAERRSVWSRCTTGLPVVVIGPRSALFCPIQKLGLVILDECHEPSYKQDSSPRYLAEHVAGKIANLTGAKLVMGSATPSITTRYMADAGKINRVCLPERAISSAHPKIEIIDTKKSSSIFSKTLTDKLIDNFKNRKLSLLYVNRRGTSPIYMCQDCGHNFVCPNCGATLHFHADSMRLVCHLCNYHTSPPAQCPKCNSTNLRGIGVGTKAVVEAIRQLLPKAKVARIDRDSSKPSHIKEILNDVSSNKLDVLVGTQMIGRGLDIANLHLVGIINADYDLLAMDYNSRERAFQLLSQTAGRAGRRETQGEVIIQTKHSQDDFYKHITSYDYESFYQSELLLRKQYSYPPFSYLLKLECGYVNPTLGKNKCLELAKKLQNTTGINILGPVVSYPAVKQRKHMWQIVVKSKNRSSLVKIARDLEPHWIINLDPFGIL